VLADGPAYDPSAWSNFAVAQVGAAAALAGLLVVATSINIGRIMASPSIVQRLAGTLTVFSVVLIVGSVLLVPGQSRVAVGVEIAALGAVGTWVVFRLRGFPEFGALYRVRTVRAAIIGLSSVALIMLAGVFCALNIAGGLYWLAPGIALAFGFGIGNTWVALVDVLR
jgi:modulator of FtsH protease